MTEAKKPQSEGKKTLIQAILFTLLSLVAFAVQFVIIQFGPMAMKGLEDQIIDAWIFGEQTLNVFLSFLIGNVAAKAISYILNRKKTFGATKNLAFSLTVYIVMCVTLIIVETLIGDPLAKAILKLIPAVGEWSATISMLLYSTADFIIVFLMEKFVIMNDNLFVKKENKQGE